MMNGMVFKAFSVILILIIPFFIGVLFLKKEERITGFSVIESYITGQILMWAAFQLIGVAMIRLKLSFSLLYYVYIFLLSILIIIGIIKLTRHPIAIKLPAVRSVVIWILIALTVVIIAFQMAMYAFGTHIDDDDARWIAQANDAITYDSMLLINPSTGEWIGSFVGDMIRDSLSPWSIYLAVLSAFTGIRPIVMAHTIYAPVLVLFSYVVFIRMGQKLFKGTNERIVFLFLVSVITLFFSGGGNTSAEFLLIRIWQGKAIVAGILIPALFTQFLTIQQDDSVLNWLMLFMMSCACCLMSGMGIVISIIMIGVSGLLLVFSKNWKRIPLWLLALLPSAIFELLYQYLA